ncbi:MAG: hypothetical protein JO204_04025 [Alphaproteobacteria bacterium]|nr:hypothetical protein [Alphaproteobacteria bacterium]
MVKIAHELSSGHHDSSNGTQLFEDRCYKNGQVVMYRDDRLRSGRFITARIEAEPR